MYLVISMCQDRTLGIVTVIPIYDTHSSAGRRSHSGVVTSQDKTPRERSDDNETQQISV